MIHLMYKCKVNFVKLPLILIYLCLKLVFENATAGRNTGCRSVVNCTRYQPTPTFPAFTPSVEITGLVHDPASCETRFTRGHVWELKNGHNSVTVQNQKHVYMNFFHHKGLGNHLLQLCPKIVKHPVYCWRIKELYIKLVVWKVYFTVINCRSSCKTMLITQCPHNFSVSSYSLATLSWSKIWSSIFLNAPWDIH